jgi:hypothetical protein
MYLMVFGVLFLIVSNFYVLNSSIPESRFRFQFGDLVTYTKFVA